MGRKGQDHATPELDFSTDILIFVILTIDIHSDFRNIPRAHGETSCYDVDRSHR